uniref:Urease ) n=1 Tax=Ganoderma boninense TaxID=34458 RepID=A0A5K1JUV6_9APHY|nr:Urease (EC (Urea amidohydrolase) [Ganoderma boninense]
MSCALVLSPSRDSLSFIPRKRTMSFSTPTACKAARTPLRRTGSYLSLADMQAPDYAPLYGRDGPTKDYTGVDSLVIGHYDARMRKRRTPPCRAPVVHATPASTQSHSSPAPHIRLSSSRHTPSRPRRSSPLAPVQHAVPERPSLPNTKKREPDLYRTAIETRMRLSPVGRNILNMGPRIAMSIFTATEALESLVAAQRDWDMPDVAVEASWVDVCPDDWEMVERDS